ncbi:MAG: 2-C-methyl-D-erythritol 4-phosphate cytidylyltransferase [Candidatus Omnitrophota bacterium]
MQLCAIIVAAGKGNRLKIKTSKALIVINKKPALFHLLETLESLDLIRHIILVARNKDQAAIRNLIKKSNFKKIKNIVCGGKERFDSVKAGLSHLCINCDLVMIHDGARPFIDKKTVTNCARTAANFGAAVVGVPAKATIKKIKNRKSKIIEETLDREQIWEIQTPQIFKKDIILKAYSMPYDKSVTDDSVLVERMGIKVRVVKGLYSNIKITTPEDLIIAKAISETESAKR